MELMVSRGGRSTSTFIPLFWRLFVPNAAVLLGAGVVLMIQPANGRVVVLAAGLAVLLTVNLVLMRRAFAPLARLTSLMDAIDAAILKMKADGRLGEIQKQWFGVVFDTPDTLTEAAF